MRKPVPAGGAARPPVRRAPAPVRRGIARVVGASRRVSRIVTAGDRPYVGVMVAVLTITAVMLVSPVDRFLEGRDRVQLLETKAAALDAENAVLERRVGDLHDPEHIELLAREQLGLVRPGEVPYVVVVPEPERPQVVPADDAPAADTRPWYARLWEAVVEFGD